MSRLTRIPPYEVITMPKVSHDVWGQARLINPEHDWPALAKVTSRSPLVLREAAEQIAYMFKREEEFDFPLYEARYPSDCTVYLWNNPTMWDDKVHVAGAAYFRIRDWRNVGPWPALTGVWIHPYKRRQGWMQAAWPVWQKEWPDFLVEPPYSKAMLGCMRKIGYDPYAHWERLEKAAKEAVSA